MYRERVTWHGALNVERPGLGVEEPRVDLLALQIGHRRERAVEGVFRPQMERVSWTNRGKWCSPAKGIDKLTSLWFEGEDVHVATIGSALRRSYVLSCRPGRFAGSHRR